MKRYWEKYINKNKDGFADCQLVAALNAYYYLTGKVYCEQSSNFYDYLIYMCGGWHGAAIDIKKVHEKLGIKILKTYDSLIDITTYKNVKGFTARDKKKKIPLPLEVGVWEKHYGYHSVLIVDHEPRVNCYRITNFKYVTNLQGWMFAEDLYQYLKTIDHAYKLYGLESDKCKNSVTRSQSGIAPNVTESSSKGRIKRRKKNF